jgi:hypothetical protein
MVPPSVFGGRGHGLAFVRDAEAAADVEMIDGEPLLLQVAGERDQRLDGPPQRVEVRDLGSDMAVQANDLETHAPVHL